MATVLSISSTSFKGFGGRRRTKMSKTKKILSREEIKERRAIKRHFHEEDEKWIKEFLENEIEEYRNIRLRNDDPE